MSHSCNAEVFLDWLGTKRMIWKGHASRAKEDVKTRCRAMVLVKYWAEKQEVSKDPQRSRNVPTLPPIAATSQMRVAAPSLLRRRSVLV